MLKFYDCGIDLGTTNSAIAYPTDDNKCQIVDNIADRMNVTPSAVAYASDVVFGSLYGGKTEAGELGLPVTESGLVLPCGATGRWTP